MNTLADESSNTRYEIAFNDVVVPNGDLNMAFLSKSTPVVQCAAFDKHASHRVIGCCFIVGIERIVEEIDYRAIQLPEKFIAMRIRPQIQILGHRRLGAGAKIKKFAMRSPHHFQVMAVHEV